MQQENQSFAFNGDVATLLQNAFISIVFVVELLCVATECLDHWTVVIAGHVRFALLRLIEIIAITAKTIIIPTHFADRLTLLFYNE